MFSSCINDIIYYNDIGDNNNNLFLFHMINRPDILASWINEYLESGLYCWWEQEDNRLVISSADDGEISDFDMDNFENE